jgi:hypothetical protein
MRAGHVVTSEEVSHDPSGCPTSPAELGQTIVIRGTYSMRASPYWLYRVRFARRYPVTKEALSCNDDLEGGGDEDITDEWA